jgi:hypothetical protein
MNSRHKCILMDVLGCVPQVEHNSMTCSYVYYLKKYKKLIMGFVSISKCPFISFSTNLLMIMMDNYPLRPTLVYLTLRKKMVGLIDLL